MLLSQNQRVIFKDGQHGVILHAYQAATGLDPDYFDILSDNGAHFIAHISEITLEHGESNPQVKQGVYL
jgi:hypothetical protein